MRRTTKLGFRAAAIAATLALGACGGGGFFPKTVATGGGGGGSGGWSGQYADGGGRYQVGKPYTVAGMHFTPREDYSYSAVGIGSWYGDKYHGRRTANGEIYDMYKFTAAHPTLPLPSVVRVTNLENGRQIDLRVNDRGPFIPGRIIDVSKVAADRLGFLKAGVAQVRVDILPGESRRLKQAMLAKRSGGNRSVAALAKPDQPAMAEKPFEFKQVA
ncbi:MAG: septal ring lytic transglycosylase RlpA family protein, partial [Pseudomonadota bacterium]